MNEHKDDLLKELARYKDHPQSTAILSDLDGTLCEIAAAPDLARMSESMRQKLIKLTGRYGMVAIVSGRDSLNAKMMVGIDNILYAGNHGLEYFKDSVYSYGNGMEKYIGPIEDAYSDLRQVRFMKGITVEKKTLSVALHYRETDDKEAAHAQIETIAENVCEKRGLKISKGRNVIELKPDVDQNKGTAVREICENAGVSRVIYAGDDVTDADAFRELKRMREENKLETMCLAVTSNEIDGNVLAEADYMLESVDDIERIMGFLSEE